MQVHVACQCSLFSKEIPIIRIFRISGWLAFPVNPDTWSSTVVSKTSHIAVLRHTEIEIQDFVCVTEVHQGMFYARRFTSFCIKNPLPIYSTS